MNTENSRLNTVCLLIIATAVIAAALIATRSVLVPFVISIFVYAVSWPGIQFFEVRLKIPRIAAIAITGLVATVILSLVFLLLFNSVGSFLLSANDYQNRVMEFTGLVSQFASRFGVEFNGQSLAQVIRGLPVFSFAQNITGLIVGLIGNFFLIVIFSIFLLLGERSHLNPKGLLWEIQSKISGYVAAKFLLSLVTGALTLFVLLALGVELAVMFAVLTLFLNFIPNVGSLIAIVLPLPVILLQYGLGWRLYLVLGLTGLIQFLVGNVVEPKMMGESMDLHPVTILLFLMFWGLVWGVPGMFLAVPITAILKIVFSRIEITRPLAELLAGRLSPNV